MVKIPVRSILRLDQIHLGESQAVWHGLLACSEKLQNLAGYMQAMAADIGEEEERIFKLTEVKHSFSLEGNDISFTRLFEACASENMLKDATATDIISVVNTFDPDAEINLSNIAPRQSLKMRRKTQTETNNSRRLLPGSAYRLPGEDQLREALKNDFNSNAGRNISFHVLTDICLLHVQLRMIRPFPVFNDHSARMLTQQKLKKQQLCHFGFLPLSRIIQQSSERYRELLDETAQSRNFQPWTIYFLGILEQAAVQYKRTIEQVTAIKAQTEDQLLKYTEYALPAKNLVRLLVSNPFIKTADIINALNCHRQTAYTILHHLMKMGILTERSSGREKLYFHKKIYDAVT